MAEKGKYMTRQRKEILDYAIRKKGSHFTAADVCRACEAGGRKIGTATVYRQLEEMVSEGRLKKYTIDESVSACFEYAGDPDSTPAVLHYHLKCEKCGRLFHLDCDEITEFERHIASHHGFTIDPMRTVFYGICASCAGKANEEGVF